MKKHFSYKAIFTSNGQKEKVEMEADGSYFSSPYRILFNYQQTHIEIEVNSKNILLKNNDSLLNLNTEQVVFNNYKLPYGYTHFKSRVDLLEYNEDYLHLKYTLFDDVSEITQAYIIITIKDILEN